MAYSLSAPAAPHSFTLLFLHPFPFHATVLHSITAETFEFTKPISVSELILEHPNYFLCLSYSLQAGRPFFPLPADEQLQFSQSYVLFPMRKLHSLVPASDLAFLSKIIPNSVPKRKIKTL